MIARGSHHRNPFLASIYLLKVNNRNTRTKREICSKLTIKTPERRHSVSIVNFEHVTTGWVDTLRADFKPSQVLRSSLLNENV